MAADIISRAEARARKLKRYFTGRPCKYGHLAERNLACGLCEECIKIHNKKFYWENKTSVSQRKAAYKVTNRQKIVAARKQKYKKEKEIQLKKTRDWYAANIDHARARRRRWIAKNRELHLSYLRNRRARRHGAEGSHTSADIAEILSLQNNRCANCSGIFGETLKPTVDHIVALVNGGTNYRRNIQLLCRRCNSSKNSRDSIEFARSAGRLL